MGMLDLALGALAVILVGGYAKKSGAGVGLSEISGGIVDLISAPLVGSATGITAFSESIGGLGRGLGDFWEAMPDLSIPFIPPIAGTSEVTGNGVNGNGFIKKLAMISVTVLMPVVEIITQEAKKTLHHLLLSSHQSIKKSNGPRRQ